MSAAQSAFINQLLLKPVTTAPKVDPALVLATGARQLRSVFTSEEMPGILLAYMHILKVAFAIAIADVGLFFCLTPFHSRKKINTPAHTDAQQTSQV